MNFIVYIISAALGAGGGMLGGLLIIRLGIAEKVPQALWLGRALFAYAWVKIAQRLWLNILAAKKEQP
jgi:hypothetical protein